MAQGFDVLRAVVCRSSGGSEAMSLLKKVLNAVKKIFKVTVKRPKKTRKASRKVKKVVKVQRSSPSRKTKKLSAPKKISKKNFKAAKSFPKKQTASSTQPRPKTSPKQLPQLAKIGEVTHYFDKIKVCVIRIDKGTIKKGDRLIIEGNKGSLSQAVSSMQIENEDVVSARKGQLIGLKVAKEVYVGDAVAKV